MSDSQAAAAEVAFQTEMRFLREVHEQKTAADAAHNRKKVEELVRQRYIYRDRYTTRCLCVSCLLQESFKNAEKQEVPAAEKLEAVARIEIFRCMDDLQEASKVRTYIHTYIHT